MLTPLCGCCLEPVNDATEASDLCSEATGTNNGIGWKIKRCRLHAAAQSLYEMVSNMLACMDANDGDSLANAANEARDVLLQIEIDERSRTENCEDCGRPTSFERTDPKTQPEEGEVCEQCQRWVCPDCIHPIGEQCPERTNTL